MFENLSLPHLLMVLAVAILVFGPKRIPEIAGSMGKGIREFKRHISEASHFASERESPEQSPTVSGENGPVSLKRPALESDSRGEPKRLID
jgi:TatA/E family protein of Tat protein translocase